MLFIAGQSCKKIQPETSKELYLKQVPNDSLGGYFDNTISEIIALSDNTFWIHYRIVYFPPFKDRFEHYDRNFRLLKTVHYANYKFGKFVVNGNNDIAVSAGYSSAPNQLSYHFIKFDNDFNVIQKNANPDIFANLQPLTTISFNTFITVLKNRKYIFGFFTSDGFPGTDSARIITASYTDPFTSSVPNWVNRNKYKDPSLGIDHNTIVDLKADAENNFYVLGMTNSYSFTLRKHSEDGNLLWQRKIPNTSYAQDRYSRIYIESDRVLVTSTLDKIYVFDLNGNYSEKKLPYRISGELETTADGNGYVAVSDTAYASAKYATLLRFDNNFDLVKVKKYGNQGTNNASAARISRLPNGNFVIAGFVETGDLTGVNLLLFKVNDDLELVE